MGYSHCRFWKSGWITTQIVLSLICAATPENLQIDCKYEICTVSHFTGGIVESKLLSDDVKQTTVIKFIESQFSSFPVSQSKRLPKVNYIKAESCGLTAAQQPLISSDSIFDAQNIKYLWLASNNFSKLDHLLFQGLSKLEILDISNCQIGIITDKTYQDLINLESLKLNGNELTILDLSVFRGKTSLYNLYVDNNKLTQVKINESWKNLQYFFVGSNKIKDSHFLSYLTNARLLDISENPDLEIMADSFNSLPHLKYLLMSGVKLSNGINYKTLFGSLPVLEKLDIGNNSLEHLNLENFPTLDSLSHFYVYSNQLTSIENLSELKLKFPKLARFDIYNNNWNCTYLLNLVLLILNHGMRLYDSKKTDLYESNLENVGCDFPNHKVEEGKEKYVIAGIGVAVSIFTIGVILIVTSVIIVSERTLSKPKQIPQEIIIDEDGYALPY